MLNPLNEIEGSTLCPRARSIRSSTTEPNSDRTATATTSRPRAPNAPRRASRPRAIAALPPLLLLLASLASDPTAVSGYGPTPTAPMAKLRIYLARHGQDADNAAGILNGHRDEPLTEVGVRQARDVAARIRESGLRFDAVYSSPLRRARRTAEIIAEEATATAATGADADGKCSGDAGEGEGTRGNGPVLVRTMDDLIERNFGTMTGVPTSQIAEWCSPDVLRTDTVTYFLSPPGAETFPDLIGRAKGVLSRIADELHPAGGSVLLVTHGDFGKMIYAAFYGLDWRDVLGGFHFGNSEVLLLSDESSAEEVHVFQVRQYNH